MIDSYKRLTQHQFDASLHMLEHCMERCPDSIWLEAVVAHKFCQVVFHTLFFTDLYLGPGLESFREQRFHLDNAKFFGDYEELQDHPPTVEYSKLSLQDYLQHCRHKACTVVEGETAKSLSQRSGFEWLDFSRAELHVYNMRHIQHHVAQLSMRLRLETGDGVPWVKSGW